MAWADKQHIRVLKDDWRYALINLTRRLLEAREPACGNGVGGTGEVGTLQDRDDAEVSER